jgi:hypothetical protein
MQIIMIKKKGQSQLQADIVQLLQLSDVLDKWTIVQVGITTSHLLTLEETEAGHTKAN